MSGETSVRVTRMVVSSNTEELQVPSLLDRRWKEIKTAIFNLSKFYTKEDLVLELIKLRERHTSAPTLNEITNFTGFDIAIHSVMGWTWDQVKENRSIEFDASEIGKLGAELMVVHMLKESIRHGLLSWEDNVLKETERGEIHFNALNSFNVDITGSRMDIVRKRFSQGRLNKTQRRMDPVNRIPSAKRLYWDNSILMLLRAPLPFYRSMQLLSPQDQEYLLKFHSKLISITESKTDGILKVRLKKDAIATRILKNLVPDENSDDRRPKFVCCMLTKSNEKGKVEFTIGIGALTMFIMFLLGFNREHLDEKARRAEIAVKDIIEHSGYFRVVESNTVVTEDNGEVITEIDLIAQSKINPEDWVTFEVKDFSFWKGWIFGSGSEMRKEYYIKAEQKIEVKENFIKQKHECEKITSAIVTSIPEPINQIGNVKLVYLSDLSEFLAKMAKVEHSPRKKHLGSNFLIRYFERLQSDAFHADELSQKITEIKIEAQKIKEEMDLLKAEYDKIRDTYKMLTSEQETLVIEEKLTRKRLVKDTGERHYAIEKELEDVRAKLTKSKRDKKIKADILRAHKEKYQNKLNEYRKLEESASRVEKTRDRYLSPRLF